MNDIFKYQFFIDDNIENLFKSFIETKEPIYVYNILIRYFHLYFNHTTTKNYYTDNIDKNTIYATLDMINTPEWKSLLEKDHTIRYSLDMITNTTLFRHFCEYDWENWKDGNVLELGSGFGIYVFMFVLLKKYYKLDNLQILSADFSEYKINNLTSLYKSLNEDVNLVCGDCTDPALYSHLKDQKIHLLYSETFSQIDALRESFFKIMDTVLQQNLDIDNTFPEDFIISKTEYKYNLFIDQFRSMIWEEGSRIGNINAIKIGKYYYNIQNPKEDAKTTAMRHYVERKFNDRIAIRWELVDD